MMKRWLWFSVYLLAWTWTFPQGAPDILWQDIGTYVSNFSPDGTLIAGGYNKIATISRIADGRMLHTLCGHTQYGTRPTFSPDGQYLVTMASLAVMNGYLGEMKLWRVSDGAFLGDFVTAGYTPAGGAFAFSPDGAMVALAEGPRVSLWRVPERTLIGYLDTADAFFETLAFSPDGQTLLAGGGSTAVSPKLFLFRLSDGALLRSFGQEASSVRKVAFAPFGQTVVSGSDDPGQVSWWNVSDGSLIRNIPGPGGPILKVEYSLDGQFLYVASRPSQFPLVLVYVTKEYRNSDGALVRTMSDHTISLSWDGLYFSDLSDIRRVSDLSLVQTFPEPRSIPALAFSPTAPILVTNGAPSLNSSWIKFWDQNTGTYLGGLSYLADDLTFSTDGSILAAGSTYDGFIHLFHMPEGTLLRTISTYPRTLPAIRPFLPTDST